MIYRPEDEDEFIFLPNLDKNGNIKSAVVPTFEIYDMQINSIVYINDTNLQLYFNRLYFQMKHKYGETSFKILRKNFSYIFHDYQIKIYHYGRSIYDLIKNERKKDSDKFISNNPSLFKISVLKQSYYNDFTNSHFTDIKYKNSELYSDEINSTLLNNKKLYIEDILERGNYKNNKDFCEQYDEILHQFLIDSRKRKIKKIKYGIS
jgi:hypothetical protein